MGLFYRMLLLSRTNKARLYINSVLCKASGAHRHVRGELHKYNSILYSSDTRHCKTLVTLYRIRANVHAPIKYTGGEISVQCASLL